MFRCMATGIRTQGRSWGAEGTPAPCLNRPPTQAEHLYTGHYQKRALWEGDQARSPDIWSWPDTLTSTYLGLMTDVHVPQGSPVNQVTSSSWVRAVSTVPGLSHSLQPHAHIGELRSPQPPLDLPRGWLPGPARRCAVDDSDVMTESWAPTETRKDVSLPTARTRGLLPLPCIGDRTWEAQLQPCLLPCQLMLPQEQVDTL